MTDEPKSKGRPSTLSLPPIEQIARELTPPPPDEPPEDAELAAMADAFVRDALAVEGAEFQRQAVDEMGVELQRQAAWRSGMLEAPIRKLAHQGDEGGPVAKALLELRGKMQDLDPARHRLSGEGLARALAFIPGVGKPLQRYFHKYEKAQDALDGIIRDLEAGADMLRRDNLTLADDQQALQYVKASPGLRLSVAILHDDAEREYAYGPAQGLPDSPVGTFSQEMYDLGEKEGWVIVSMKDDWKKVFAFEE